MTRETTDRVLAAIIEREDGLSDHAADRGGLTHYGLTKPFLQRVTGRAWTDDDVRGLSRARALAIYRLWLQITRLDMLPDHRRFAEAVVDYAVHAGERHAIRAAQRAVGVPADGIAGPDTQGAWARMTPADGEVGRLLVIADRLRRLGRLIATDRSQSVFAAGWMNRIADVLVG